MRNTNAKIAAMLLKQTYTERLEMAQYLYMADWSDSATIHDLADLIGSWAEGRSDEEAGE